VRESGGQVSEQMLHRSRIRAAQRKRLFGVVEGKIKATRFVVPGSGTSELSGLDGEGGFEGDFVKGI